MSDTAMAADASGTGSRAVRTLIADDQELVRAGFRSLLERTPDIEVVGEVGDGLQAVAFALAERPEVVLMDIRMPGIDGLEATRRIVGDPRSQGVRVVILTTFDLDSYIFEALRIGASGFLAKNVAPDDLRHAVRIAAVGEALLTPSVTRRVIERFARLDDSAELDRSPLAVLTEREREVLGLVARGLSNQELAERLYMSPLTAKTHVSRMIAKLGVRDRVQLVVLAYETGLARPGRSG